MLARNLHNALAYCVLVGLLSAALLAIPAAVIASNFAHWRMTGVLPDETSFLLFWDMGGLAGEHARILFSVICAGGFALGAFCASPGSWVLAPAYGAAFWAGARHIRQRGLLAKRIEQVRGPILGKLGRPWGFAPYVAPTMDRLPHSLVVAPTGAGKGVGVVIPSLLTFPGSVICLDVKGENFKLSAARRAELGDRVFKFSPYDPDQQSHGFNPLEMIAAASERMRYTEARRLASQLLSIKSTGAQGFLEGAKELLAAGVVYVIEAAQKRGDAPASLCANLGDVYALLIGASARQAYFEELAARVESPDAGAVFARMAGTEDRILSSYVSVLADGGLGIWGDPRIRAATARSDFTFVDFRSDPASLYIVVSPNDLAVMAPLIRLLFQQAVAVLQSAEPTKDEPFPVLFVLDEFASLGRMEALETAITTLRSYGGRLLLIVQAMASLNSIYGQEAAKVFISNAGLQLFMAPADADTAAYISRSIGQYTRNARSFSSGAPFVVNVTDRAEGAPLIREEELRMLDPDRAVILVQNSPPILCRRVKFYEDRVLSKLASSGQRPDIPMIEDRMGDLRTDLEINIKSQEDALRDIEQNNKEAEDALRLILRV